MIKADRWIATRSTPPSHILHTVHGRDTTLAWEGITHTPKELESKEQRYIATRLRPEDLSKIDWKPMIEPFVGVQVRYREDSPLSESDKFDHYNGLLEDEVVEKDGGLYRKGERLISFGTSSYGYDVRLSTEFKLFTNLNSAIIDPKRFDTQCLVDAVVHTDETGDEYVILPPNSYLLGRTVEYFRIPRNVTVIAVGKSTLARAGAIVNVTPIEAEFEGNVVIEISNATNLPMKIYANEGIAQFLFFESDQDCITSYADREGKYMFQTGVVTPRV